jgi:hypothetical protein
MKIESGPVQAHLIKLIDDARERLVLVSPYIKLWTMFSSAIERAATRDVDISVIVRGGRDQSQQERELLPIRSSLRYVGFIERLHAKIYLNEKSAILTSLNLVRGSALDTIEVSAFLEQRHAAADYNQLSRICDKFITQSREDALRVAAKQAATKTAIGHELEHGHCIRCAVHVAFDVKQPLCARCLTAWSRYKNQDYPERHCFQCGQASQTSFCEPLCFGCSSASAPTEAHT